MKAYQIDNYGSLGNLMLRDFPAAAPETGQVRVRVYATSVDPIDSKMAAGNYSDRAPLSFPYTPGEDFSGVVDAVGDGVQDIQVNDEVYGCSFAGGAYAELLTIDAGLIAAKPRTLSHIEAAGLALVGQTALQALDAGNLASGQTLLIHGASGGVGSAAVQLAHSRGARVIATASAKSLNMVRELGADHVIDYKATPFDSIVSDVDVVLDTIGGETQQRSFGVLKPGGCLVSLVGVPPPDDLARLNLRAIGISMQSTRANLDALTQRVDAGDLKPVIGKTYPLSEVATVWRDMASLHVTGKIVFIVAGAPHA